MNRVSLPWVVILGAIFMFSAGGAAISLTYTKEVKGELNQRILQTREDRECLKRDILGKIKEQREDIQKLSDKVDRVLEILIKHNTYKGGYDGSTRQN